MILIIETAATNFVAWNVGDHHPSQPYATRASWALVSPDDPATPVEEPVTRLMRPLAGERRVPIHSPAVEHWGIATDDLSDAPHPREVMREFEQALGRANMVVAHALRVHRKVLTRTAYAWDTLLEWPEGVCLMEAARNIVRKPNSSGRGFAWPKMGESHQFFLGEPMPADTADHVANGTARVLAVARVLKALVSQGAVAVPERV